MQCVLVRVVCTGLGGVTTSVANTISHEQLCQVMLRLSRCTLQELTGPDGVMTGVAMPCRLQ